MTVRGSCGWHVRQRPCRCRSRSQLCGAAFRGFRITDDQSLSLPKDLSCLTGKTRLIERRKHENVYGTHPVTSNRTKWVRNPEVSFQFPVTVFTGVPEQSKKSDASYARALRLAAAKAGIDKILVYWGMVETETKDLATKNVSWVPIL